MEDPIVIAGIGARLPGRRSWCDEVDEGIDSKARWPRGTNGIQQDVVTISEGDKFDAGAFSLHTRMTFNIDAQSRILHETVWEAMVDGGYNPATLRGSDTGVWIGCSRSETGESISGIENFEGYMVLGNCRAMYANRLSFSFDLHGCSVTVDAGAATSCAILNTAVNYLEAGLCQYAIVGAANLMFKPGVQLGFDKVMSGAEYTRGENIITILLTKASLAHRPYAVVRGASSAFVGSPVEDRLVQSALEEMYTRCNLDQSSVDSIELGQIPTSCQAELVAVNRVFPNAQKGRGKTANYEAGAGLEAILRACAQLRKTERVLAINDISIGGNFAHVVLSSVKDLLKTEDSRSQTPLKQMKSDYHLKDKSKSPMRRVRLGSSVEDDVILDPADLPILASGRTRESVSELLHLYSNCDKAGEVALHQLSVRGPQSTTMTFRGYSHSTEEIINNTHPPPVWLVCGGVGAQWAGMLDPLLKHPLGQRILCEMKEVLQEHGFDIDEAISSKDDNVFDDPKALFVSLAMVQCIQIEILRGCKVPISGVIGHSFGEHAAAYVAGCLTMKEFILSALARGKVVSHCQQGAMAVVKMSWDDAQKLAEECHVEAACDNAPLLVTMSGTIENITKMVHKLKSRGEFARLINSGHKAFHSTLVRPAAAKLCAKLNRLITEVREPQVEWISSSNQRPFSSDYLGNNIKLSVRFTEAAKRIPANALVIEVGANPILKPMLRHLDNEVISLAAKDKPHITMGQALGQLFARGQHVIIPRPRQELKEAGPLGHRMKWDHSETWYIPKFDDFMSGPPAASTTLRSKIVSLDLEGEDSYLKGHCIDGSSILPGAVYISSVIDVLLEIQAEKQCLLELTDIVFLRATPLLSGTISLHIHVQPMTGAFTVEEGGSTVCRGLFSVREYSAPKIKPHRFSFTTDEGGVKIDAFYEEMRKRGYSYKDEFCMVSKLNEEKKKCVINWTEGNKIILIDGALQLSVWNKPGRRLVLPSTIKRLVFCPAKYKVERYQHRLEMSCNFEKDSWSTESLTVQGISGTAVERRRRDEVMMFTEEFFPYQLQDSSRIYDDEVLEEQDAMLNEIQLEDFADVLKKKAFNSLLREDRIKPFLDIVMENLKQRVSIYIVSSAKVAWKSQLEKWYPNKVVILKELQSLEQLQDHITTETGSALFVLNHVIYKENEGEVVKWLNSVIGKDAFLIINQVDNIQETSQLLSGCKNFKPAPEALSKHLKPSVIASRSSSNCTVTLLKGRGNMDMSLCIADDEVFFLDDHEVKEKVNGGGLALLLDTVNDGKGGVGFARCCRAENMMLNSVSTVDEDAEDVIGVVDSSLVLNVKRGGVWGTLVKTPLQRTVDVVDDLSELAGRYVNIEKPGDLSSLAWTRKQYTDNSAEVHYCALNCRDVMIASGNLNVTALPFEGNPLDLYALGIEFSGQYNGQAVMGIVPCRGLASRVEVERRLLWQIPSTISPLEAATIPLAYSTAYYSLIVRAKMMAGQSVLIHRGAGAVGQAAIRIALHKGCGVYTTVSTKKKQQFLLNLFPSLHKSRIGHSRSTAFVGTVMKGTLGRGVDIVLNSLTGKLLEAGASCLAPCGHFVEIGKYDMQQNTPIPRSLARKGCQVHGVQVEELWLSTNQHLWSDVYCLVADGLESGVVQPLNTTVFKEVHSALRFLNSGAHIGKVLVELSKDKCEPDSEMRDPLEIVHGSQFQPAFLRQETDVRTAAAKREGVFEFQPVTDGHYLITGGMGSLGLEVATWLVEGGGSVILLDGSEPSAVAQLSLSGLQRLGDSRVCVEQGSVFDEVFMGALFVKYKIAGIFHLAGSLADATLPSCTKEDWVKVNNVKISGALLLDALSRRFCEELHAFVCFSSIVAAFGNADQCCDGYVNSALDRLCTDRVQQGLAGLSIQWGLINDGMGTDVEQVCGSGPLSLSSFHWTLGRALRHLHTGVILAYTPQIVSTKSDDSGSLLLSKVLRVMGVRDLTSQGDISLTRFGLDSLISVELSELLSREAGVNLTPDEIRELTFSTLATICTKQ